MKRETRPRHMVSRELLTFLAIKRGQKLSQNTSVYYEGQLSPFMEWCDRRPIVYMDEITHEALTEYLDFMAPSHTEGGQWHLYATIKTFLNWYQKTAMPKGWTNPIELIDAPKRPNDPIQGVTQEEFERMIAQCRADFYGVRDRAIMSFLYDTGVRVTECCNILVSQVDLRFGAAYVLHGKGRKSRFVIFGDACRIELNKYFRVRTDDCQYLFAHIGGEQLKREAVRSLLLKYANLAGVTSLPSPHDFRRGWVHETRKVAGDLNTARAAGHSNTKELRRYDYQTLQDMLEALSGSSPLDNLKRKTK